METIDGLLQGFSVAFQWQNLMWVTIGVVVGTVVGLLPGLGPMASIALLLPLTFNMEPASGIIMLAGIYYGSMYGGRIPAILLRLPGDTSSVVTTFDGYPLAQQGRAGVALSTTAIGSFIGGTIAILGLTFFAPVLARYATQVTSGDMFLLASVGILMIVFLGSGSKWRAIAMAGLGLVLATVGLDPVDGTPRLTFGNVELSGGINIVPVAVGLFGIGELLHSADVGFHGAYKGKAQGRNLPSWADWVYARMAILRASIIGFFIGILPGGGGTISSVVAYGAEKKFSKHPERFGKGALDGLAATETADNASSNSAFIPLLTLGIPPNPVLALLFGALLLQNITPGPQLIQDEPDVFWGVIASMYVGNILLLILNLPLIGLFVRILRIRGSLLAPVIIIVALYGVYSVNNSFFDLILCVGFGVAGYLLKKWNFELGPLILAFILGPIIEVQFRRTMLSSGGDFMVFVDRPLSLIILLAMSAVIIVVAFNRSRTGYQRFKDIRRSQSRIHS